MLKFHPARGTLLLCAYEPGFVAPEMIKRRVVVVMSPRLRRRDGLCTVIPLSRTEPSEVCDFHVRVPMQPELPDPWAGPEKWAKADMMATVGFHRLHLIGDGRKGDGQRKYLTPKLSEEKVKEIECAMLCALGLGSLTNHERFTT